MLPQQGMHDLALHADAAPVDDPYLDESSLPGLVEILLNHAGNISAILIQALPKPDIALDHPCTPIKYTHRTWQDAELYFFFNESSEKQARTALVELVLRQNLMNLKRLQLVLKRQPINSITIADR